MADEKKQEERYAEFNKNVVIAKISKKFYLDQHSTEYKNKLLPTLLQMYSTINRNVVYSKRIKSKWALLKILATKENSLVWKDMYNYSIRLGTIMHYTISSNFVNISSHTRYEYIRIGKKAKRSRD